MKKIKISKAKIVLLSVIIFIVLVCVGFYIYTLDYYRASNDVISIDEISNAESINNMVVFNPTNKESSETGIIFYPGGKVEAIAYAPILAKLADEGYTCVLVEMPMNLAVFNIKGADKVYENFPDIEKWYLMGHSLGGAMASSYCEKNYDKLDGLILLGAYPVNDAEIDTLVIYGSEDLGLDLEKLEGFDDVHRLEGGNHAYFGNYGEQEGDGTATMSRDTQQDIAVELIVDFIKGK